MTIKTHHIAALLLATAYNNAGWKLDADGKIVMKDGNPVWVDANGGEAILDGGTITRLNGEAKTLRERAEKAETKLTTFKDIDPDKARQALETLGKIDQKTLIDAGKVDEVRQQITTQFTAQLAEKDNALKALQTNFDNAQINSLFAGSDFIRERVAVPRDMFEATFKNNFKMEDGKPVAYGKDGNRLMSKAKIGEFADAAEALELLVDQHPQKDVILKASGGTGTGNNGNTGGRGGGKTMKRAEFDQLQGHQQAEVAAKARAGEMQIVD
jgi:hypothetical protein